MELRNTTVYINANTFLDKRQILRVLLYKIMEQFMYLCSLTVAANHQADVALLALFC